MKAITSFTKFISEALLLEVGDSSTEPFAYELAQESSEAVVYRFITDSGVEYEVEAAVVDPFRNDIVQLSFSVGGSVEVVVNRGEAFRVMATVMEITREILNRNPEIKILAIEPSKNYPGDERRYRLYLAYIRREWPDAVIKKRDEEIYVKIK